MEFRPHENDELTVELQATFTPASGRDAVTLEKTNFGLLAVRVSKSISEVFGSGKLTADDGATGEPALFGKPHRWVDYSGASPFYDPQPIRQGKREAKWFDEGITYFDHPSNPNFPNAWHVRADGWMCASPCFHADIVCSLKQPLELRYLLHVHGGRYQAESAEQMFAAFAESSPMRVRKSNRGHVRNEIVRQ